MKHAVLTYEHVLRIAYYRGGRADVACNGKAYEKRHGVQSRPEERQGNDRCEGKAYDVVHEDRRQDGRGGHYGEEEPRRIVNQGGKPDGGPGIKPAQSELRGKDHQPVKKQDRRNVYRRDCGLQGKHSRGNHSYGAEQGNACPVQRKARNAPYRHSHVSYDGYGKRNGIHPPCHPFLQIAILVL